MNKDVKNPLLYLGNDIGQLPYLKSTRSKQVTTHTHDKPHPWKPDLLHQDYKVIDGQSHYTFPEMDGPGCLSCIWFTIMPVGFHNPPPNIFQALSRKYRTDMLKDIKPIIKNWSWWQALRYRRLDCLRYTHLKIFFDSETTPSVDAPLGDFFGVGFGEYIHYTSQFVGMTSGGYYCYFPMPFAKKCRIEIHNTHHDNPITFYGAVSYQCFDEFDENLGYFHAKYRRENPTYDGLPYTILEATGRGHYVGCLMNMRGLEGSKFRFLEGNLKIYVDDDEEPSMEYTGTEDYFMSGWYFNKGTFCAPYHGITIKDKRRNRVSAYRYHVYDAPSFDKKIRVVLPHGEFNEIKSDYSSVAYWYQKEPHDNFFELSNEDVFERRKEMDSELT